MKMLTELGGWDLEVASVVYLTDKKSGRKGKLATIRPADWETFPDKTQPFNIKEMVEVQVFFEGDVSTFYFSNVSLLPHPHRLELLHSPEEIEQYLSECLIMWKVITLEHFLTHFAYLVMTWQAAPSLFSFKRV